MLKSSLDPACTGLFSSLFLDYIHKKESVKQFYKDFPDLEQFKKSLPQKHFEQEKRSRLVRVLEKQYEGFEGAKVKANIQQLNQVNTFTVTTGHQLNLMTGPSYFIYKIISTIALADKLNKENPDYHFVPVYWMATEDHDFAEINHFYFDGKNYEWQTDQTGAVGEFVLDESLKKLIGELHFLPEFFKTAYTQSKFLKEAVRKYVHHLFADRGLVIIDANEKELKQLFVPVIKDDILNATANNLVNDCNSALEKAGYSTQIFPREINFFYMEKGRRERLILNNGFFETHDGKNKWDEAEMTALIEQKPENFSPNVVMRPLYQEVILPNIAYLGGPAEVAYWFQLKNVFAHYSVDYPFLLPRNFAMILTSPLQRKMNKLRLEEKELFLPFDDLRIKYVKENSDQDLELIEERDKLNDIYKALAEKSQDMDATLTYAVKAAHKRNERILDQVATKFRKAEERKKATAIQQIAEIKKELFPQGTLQERKINFLEFYLGNPEFIKELFDTFDPLNFDFILLKENGDKRSIKKATQN
ncbi:bacillithiol biosynthesis cysteine-adding enzyme BshC [Cyclobacterium marinum]|uniref:bacillithiol biosynthesis cysteine-adding enzyme BshC n=1 Tax=Cyclobacterium marinum TaxID=104 RepID=UPI0011EEE817|nr:bacillithiol biosynthesis cysteine-adding enzyme BshC [Cyclobacterium marinum]MBI0401414.1 bacillithiol biosynthesis cysteine-adding enzyme BshC [Cyclobacterium marinum]